ncbi:unnamed protein product, partial [Mesorhabditis belari]|uniref:G-protein coupled receptors family 1 profile domain-containing protein n=1 Tax=Mesorhabditis belari TaxID=2138241 RepID=A0AAF3FK08_9BILA
MTTLTTLFPPPIVGEVVAATVASSQRPIHTGLLSTLSPHSTRLCLGLHDVFIALFLVMLILMTIFGNVLVVLSVFVYKRMRTFTNILLTSLATADLLVGLVVMPLSLLDLLHTHQWPFGRFLCSLWATSDVLLCTASILNLCVISLDRYFAITSPLKYPRTRSKKMAAGLLSAVWVLSLVICSPPWFVPSWGLFDDKPGNGTGNSTIRETFTCQYSPSVPYRIYSALGSFFVPLIVMLFVYFKIFNVANDREKVMRESIGTYRLSNRLQKTQQKTHQQMRQNRARLQLLNNNNTSTVLENGTRINYTTRPIDIQQFRSPGARPRTGSRVRADSSENDESPPGDQDQDYSSALLQSTGNLTLNSTNGPSNSPGFPRLKALERECHSMADLQQNSCVVTPPQRKSTEVHSEVPLSLVKKAAAAHSRLQPSNLLAKAQEHYQTCGPGKSVRGSKEKMVYLRERKALKTIGIVVLGFIICWLPFFLLYLFEVFFDFKHFQWVTLVNEFFLWLGYSNSVLNPIIYTMYNGDFRRCFRDLLSFGCARPRTGSRVRADSSENDESPPGDQDQDYSSALLQSTGNLTLNSTNGPSNSPGFPRFKALERECHSMADLQQN